jgi:hypothetical protein
VGEGSTAVGAGVGAVDPAGAVKGVGAVENTGAPDEGADVASSCAAPEDPTVVDEHPATDAVTSTNPTVSSFRRVLIAYPNL